MVLHEPGKGYYVIVQGASEGVSVFLSEDWTIAAIENYLKEVREMLA